MSETELLQLGLGEKVLRLRERRALERDETARRSGLSRERLAAIETGDEVPAIGELVQLARTLDVSLGHFFQRSIPARRVEVVRAADRWTVQPQTELARTLNYRYESLSYNLTDKLMSPFLVEIPPDDAEDVPPSQHEGEEFLFVLQGQLEVRIGDELHRLSPGDSIYFDSSLEHWLRASEGTSVRLLACVAQERRTPEDNPIGRAYS